MHTQKVIKLQKKSLMLPEWFKIKTIFFLSKSFMVIGIAIENNTPDNLCIPVFFEVDNKLKDYFVGLNSLENLIDIQPAS
jgi:hypothetical protein